jgi:hypothetical protein
MNIRLIIPNTFTEPGEDAQTGKPCTLKTCFRPLDKYGSRIADIAGGFTSWVGIGGWKDSQGALIVEPVTIVECSIDECGDRIGNMQLGADIIRADFRLLARDIAKDLHQDCVYLSIDGVVEYVKA